MTKTIIFSAVLLLTIVLFLYSMRRIFGILPLLRPFVVSGHLKRLGVMMQMAFGQSRIFRRPGIGLAHALVFWGFLVITIGSIEMVIDGLSGRERVFSVLGRLYALIVFSGDVFSVVVAAGILIFMARRWFMRIGRFYGLEMKTVSKIDAGFALMIIFLLMVSLIGTNAIYVAMHPGVFSGVFPVSAMLAPAWSGMNYAGLHLWHEVFWWTHILLIFAFANYLPYSKHFHVFTSIPNVYLSRLSPLGSMDHLPHIEKEVRLMLNPGSDVPAVDETTSPARFGAKDIEDLTWKSYLDALACTECGRCTAVCPANITGKKLSPRKIVMDVRARAKEKRALMMKSGKGADDGRALLYTLTTAEELWACTTCNACARECPININQPVVILELRRFLVMEEAAVPPLLANMFANIENNGAPWQYPSGDREIWMQ